MTVFRPQAENESTHSVDELIEGHWLKCMHVSTIHFRSDRYNVGENPKSRCGEFRWKLALAERGQCRRHIVAIIFFGLPFLCNIDNGISVKSMPMSMNSKQQINDVFSLSPFNEMQRCFVRRPLRHSMRWIYLHSLTSETSETKWKQLHYLFDAHFNWIKLLFKQCIYCQRGGQLWKKKTRFFIVHNCAVAVGNGRWSQSAPIQCIAKSPMSPAWTLFRLVFDVEQQKTA